LTAPLLKDDGAIFGTIGITIYTPVPAGGDPTGRTGETISVHDCRTLPSTLP